MPKKSTVNTKKSKKDNPFTIQQKEIFSQRLKSILKTISDENYDTAGIKGINRKLIIEDFKKYSGGMEISEQSLSHYTRGQRLPQIDMFLGIVNFCSHFICNFNADYLLGLSDVPTKEDYNISVELGFKDDVIKILREIKLKNQTATLSNLLSVGNFANLLQSIGKIESVYTAIREAAHSKNRTMTNEDATDLLHYAVYLLDQEVKYCIEEVVEKVFKASGHYVHKDEIESIPFRRKKLDKKIADLKNI